MASTAIHHLDPRLASPPARISHDLDPTDSGTFDGLLKVRLGHSKAGSVLVPEQLFVKLDCWRFFQTSFFGPPFFRFNIEDGPHDVRFNMDMGGPRSTQAARLLMYFRSDGLARQFDDGAQLYKCNFGGPKQILRYLAGRARTRTDGDFDLELFHITNSTAAAGIRASHGIWGSPWNLQGTRKLKNVAYIYLTSLPSVRDEDDLKRIAMASGGKIGLQTTSSNPVEEVLEMIVYREDTIGRTNPLPVTIPSAYVAPPHLLLHRSVIASAYYEVVGPEIFRIGVRPGAVLNYNGVLGTIDVGDLKSFVYLVLGDAAKIGGLAAAFDEEDTNEIMHIEHFGPGEDIFRFWLTHRNTDQLTGRTFEQRQLEHDPPC
jgi:hypothetical protein